MTKLSSDNASRHVLTFVILKTNNFRAFNFGYFLVSMPVALVAILVPFTLTGGVLTAEKLFLTLNLYRVSRLTMTMFFPIATSSIGEIRVSIKRIQVQIYTGIQLNNLMTCMTWMT